MGFPLHLLVFLAVCFAAFRKSALFHGFESGIARLHARSEERDSS